MTVARIGTVLLGFALGAAYLLPLASRAETVTESVTFTVEIVEGCKLGVGGTNPASFGTIDFGQTSFLDQAIDGVGTAGAGAVVVNCAPGTDFTIALGDGQNGGGVGERYMSDGGGNFVRYDLYQDASRSVAWTSVSTLDDTADGTEQVFPVYGRVPSSGTTPPSGLYTDEVVVTVSF